MAPDAMSPQAPSRNRWLAPVGLAVLLGGLFFLRLGQDVPLRSHEALLAESARNMFLDREVHLADGSHPSAYMVPNFNGVPRLRKTPLPYWTVAGLAHLTGTVDEWTARFPSALAALGTVLILTAFLYRWCDRRTALLGGAALTTTIGFFLNARMAIADMPLAFFTTASLAAAWMGVEQRGPRRFGWFVLAGAAGGLAMLAKGPVPAIVFPLPYGVAAIAALAQIRRDRRSGAVGRGEWGWTLAGAAVAALVFVAISLPWLIYLRMRVPEALTILKAESVDRSIGDYGHQKPFYFYLVRLPALLAPWGLFFIYGLVVAVRRWKERPQDRPWLLFVGAWLVGPFVGLSLAAGKQDHYILPILPATAVYVAMAMRYLLAPTSSQAERLGRPLLILHGGVAVLLGGASVLAYGLLRVAPALYAHPPSLALFAVPAVLGPVAVVGGLGAVGGLAVTVLAARRRFVASQILLFVTVAVVFLVAWPMLMGPMDRLTTAAAFARDVRQTVPAEVPLFAFNGPNNSVVFYAERTLVPLATAHDVQGKMAEGRPFFIIVNDKHLERLKDVLGLVPLVHVKDPYCVDEGYWLFRWPEKGAAGSACEMAPAGQGLRSAHLPGGCRQHERSA